MKTHKELITVLAIILLSVVSSPTSAALISTIFAANNGCQGNMFDLENVSSEPILLTGRFEGNFNNTATGTIEIWYRAGSYKGYISDPTGWNLLGTALLNSQGRDNPTPFHVGNTLKVDPGQTIGLFMYLDGPHGGVAYTNGTGFYTDDVLELSLGIGKCWSSRTLLTTPPVDGGTFSPRVWNGTIEYIPEPATIALLAIGGLVLRRRHRR